ncbi:hypothetical protein THERMOT_1863 [Bathymodiolus thermophilus thioautotrophic gill symbiont]|nr:hypothetical protein THERMOT_1863 [Bathymodiolus thermophilus thioautotrophic gill symbiont]
MYKYGRLAKFNFCSLVDFFKSYFGKSKAGFKKIAKWAKSGFLIIHNLCKGLGM